MELRDKFMAELIKYMAEPVQEITKSGKTPKCNKSNENTLAKKYSLRSYNLFTYGPKDHELTREETSLAFIDLWTEPQIFKFNHETTP
jgi:hypothetical protein